MRLLWVALSAILDNLFSPSLSMDLSRTLRLNAVPPDLVSQLELREAAIWITEEFVRDADTAALSALIRLPWRMVLCESVDPQLFTELNQSESPADLLVRRRGFLHFVEESPTEVTLPPRALPIFLLNGQASTPSRGGLRGLTRRLNMLAALREAEVRTVLIGVGTGSLPNELGDLWADGLRASILAASAEPSLPEALDAWRHENAAASTAAYLVLNANDLCREIVAQYQAGRGGDRVALRLRDHQGTTQVADVTGLDDPERPILAKYELIHEGDLRPLPPDGLSREELEAFFRDASVSWRPYAAGVPWQPNDNVWDGLRTLLRRLDRDGPDSTRVAFLRSEPGAGGTTIARMLAWRAAAEGYPTLVARPTPFVPAALELVTFLTKILEAAPSSNNMDRRYEVPWLIVFDRMHWEERSAELRKFSSSLAKAGRAVCILVVTSPQIGLDFLDVSRFTQVATLSHSMPASEVIALGRHLNRFLAPHGATRSEAEWQSFYRASAVDEDGGVAAFWAVLSFWLQRQFDLSETIQSWLYRHFREGVKDPALQRAIIDIGAMSTERIPLPEALLPTSGEWPTWQRIDDLRSNVGALALVRLQRDGERFWAMAQTVLGRFLLNALFYDPVGRIEAGFADARSPEHLRFLALARLAGQPVLARPDLRVLAEDFAVAIFKIDPGHGHASFLPFWRDALSALDAMPLALRTSSRAFRHHTAISRRRVAKQPREFDIGPEEQVALLKRAIQDIRYALESIPPTVDGDSDLNLLNSLAHALQDLAETEAARGADPELVLSLRSEARAATRRAYQEAPDNSFVTETYARDLLSDAELSSESATANAIEALNVIYAAMQRDSSSERRSSLGRLADRAMHVLFSTASLGDRTEEPKNEVEAIARAIHALTAGVPRFDGLDLEDFPDENRKRAVEFLSAPVLQGNAQAVRLRYTLICLASPLDHRAQLELLEQLQNGHTVFSPQMRLELAVLLHECSRYHEGDQQFRRLRDMWRQGEHYVEVPNRLRWLMTAGARDRQLVNARVVQDLGNRQVARIAEMQDLKIPFRPQEFGKDNFRPGERLRGTVSFGHNGPFLRPPTAA